MTNRRHVISIGAASMAHWLTGCGGGGSDEPPRGNLQARRIIQSWAPIDLEENHVIRNDAEWQRVWAKHQPRGEPAPARTRVDFSIDMVVGLSRGQVKGSGKSGIAITKVVETASELRIEYQWGEYVLGAAGGVPPDSPFADFAVVPASDKPARFQPAEVLTLPITPLQNTDLDTIASVQWPGDWPFIHKTIRTRDEWVALWNTNLGPRSASDTCAAPCAARRPELDFARYTLVCMFGEIAMGSSIRIDTVRQVGDLVYVDSRVDTAPGGHPAIQTPFILMALIPKTSAPVMFTQPHPGT